MRKIYKGKEPKEWMEYRLTPGAKYASKPQLVDALLKEQGYICAYCMRRIPTRDSFSSENHRIEHIKCRDSYPDLELNYDNMVICCPGAISGRDSKEFHCDKAKGNKDISFSPLDVDIIKTIRYKTLDGTIYSTNQQWDEEINSVLNLNNPLLKLNRKNVIYALIEELKSGTKRGSINKAWFDRQLEKWSSKDTNGRLKPYCGVVEWFLTKKLNRYK